VGRVASAETGVSITLDSDTPLLHDVAVGDVVYKANQVAIGNILETNYFAVQLLQLERATSRPIGFDFWKGAIGGGMTFSTNAEDFASTELTIKLLQPDGQLIGEWRITGYGQQDQGDMGLGSENAMKEAAITALRDAAANIVVGFAKAPGVEKYILPDNDLPAEDTTESDETEENTI